MRASGKIWSGLVEAKSGHTRPAVSVLVSSIRVARGSASTSKAELQRDSERVRELFLDERLVDGVGGADERRAVRQPKDEGLA